MTNQRSRRKFVKTVEKIILENGGVLTKEDTYHEGGTVKSFEIMLPANRISISLYPENSHDPVYSVYSRFANIPKWLGGFSGKNNFHSGGRDIDEVLYNYRNHLGHTIFQTKQETTPLDVAKWRKRLEDSQ